MPVKDRARSQSCSQTDLSMLLVKVALQPALLQNCSSLEKISTNVRKRKTCIIMLWIHNNNRTQLKKSCHFSNPTQIHSKQPLAEISILTTSSINEALSAADSLRKICTVHSKSHDIPSTLFLTLFVYTSIKGKACE